MLGAKFEVQKFDESNNFGLWKIKMKPLLVRHGLEGALEGEEKLPMDLSPEQRKSVMSNKVLWKVCDQVSAPKVLQEGDRQSEQLRPWERCMVAESVVLCDAEVENTICQKVNFIGCIIMKLKKPSTSEESKGGLHLSDYTR
ncbi:hypothetical protein CRG98_011718 [Punica granatum]|uniref:Uncharacterized protein n=1 Tax=Punica granatum TaxID=22663 RepID=A0A2I0KHW8_PUNGR|nr:hypothetical protein CRG98_011718 [Punica granatum]